ncbi:uncharacterized protein [Chironomus tepperi]|uniref:uncharacterized protein n=1 Tax=Chironomus tepperi TaxID=113505 RepID=UPI00391EF6E5
MSSIADEIQRISDDADKCINYAIGDKLAAFMKQQDEQDCPNFVLSGVLIYAAAKIFGRKVDCLEQEIIGVAKNFERVEAETSDGKDKEPKEAAKKTRQKKYNIKDGVNIDKILFEEKEIIISVKDDINKELAMPCKISRLQKMKDFFARNKEKSGKIAIPKSMLLTNETAVTNFGSTQIYDYDDYKDIVGSRRDFTSFSFYINSCTGELQNDLNFSKQTKTNDYLVIDHEHQSQKDVTSLVNDNAIISHSNDDALMTSNTTTITNTTDDLINDETDLVNEDCNEISDFTPPATPPTPNLPLSGKVTPINLNLDEGIEMDIDQSSLLLPPQPIIKINDIMRQSPGLFSDMNVNDYVVMNFTRSILTVLDKIKDSASDFTLPDKIKAEVGESRMKNIFMIPIKRLKHKCLFDLPDSEFRELKRRKLDQHKSTVVDQPEHRQSRVFKILDLLKNCNVPSLNSSINHDDEDEDTPFLGFTKDEQNESRFLIPTYNSKKTNATINSHQTTTDNSLINENPQTLLRKVSNDSGYTSECINSSNELDDSAFNNDNEISSRLNSIDEQDDSEQRNLNISGTDSCYQSLASGQSGNDDNSTINNNASSFIDDYKVGNSTENELELSNDKEQELTSLESEERIQLMRQSAINVAKWKEFLKPILANSEKRSKIDMHEYGLKVIHKIGDVNDSKTLREISEPEQMPAYFFTMLQLTNNRNIDISFTDKTIREPTALENIKLTLKSKVVHKDKFDQMGQQFETEELNKVTAKRKGNLKIQTSTPAKRSLPNEPLNFNSPNSSQSVIDNTDDSMRILSQASSGYFSQNSTYSDF